MSVMKDKSIEETAVVAKVAPEPALEPAWDLDSKPAPEPAVKVVAEPAIAKEPVVVQAKKEEAVSVGGAADERVVVGGSLRGTNFASDGTAYLFTNNGVCAIFKKHLPEFQARGCSEL